MDIGAYSQYWICKKSQYPVNLTVSTLGNLGMSAGQQGWIVIDTLLCVSTELFTTLAFLSGVTAMNY